MRHLGTILAALAVVLGLTAYPSAASAASGGEAVTPRASASTDCMASTNDWAKRPSGCAYLPKVVCQGAEFCIHYNGNPGNANYASPTWVSETKSALNYIYGSYRKSGYRMPRADHDRDPKSPAPSASANAVDIYLVDFATFDHGAFAADYGYCAPAQPKTALATSAFCVFDRSYADTDSRGKPIYTTGSETPLDILHVTAAHEFFHAIQYGYDASADPWIMEASSTWAEDQLYTDVNDNRQYLRYGPMGKPAFPMDDSWYEQHGTGGGRDPRDYTPYGDWIFLRYLTEHFPGKSGPLPVIVRQIWQGMDSTRHTPKSSIDAVAAALRQHHTTLVRQWGAFTAANRAPATYYSEGAAYHAAKPTVATTVSTAHATRSGAETLAHLTAKTVRLTGVRVPKNRRLWLHVVAPAARSAVTTAWVTVFHASGKVSDRAIPLHKGVGSASVAFGAAAVTRVELTLGNAQTTYRCNTGKLYSCDGTPTGDGLKVSWRAQLRR